MSKYSYNKNFFEQIDTEEKAYWLGFLYADGCITRFYKNDKLKSMSLELSLQEKDSGHLFKFLKDLDSNVPIQTRKHKLNGKIYYSKRVVINCTKMCRDLIGLGCTPQKANTISFPSNEVVPLNLVHHFIRGYFDGDGCIHFGKYDVFHKNRNKWYNQKSFAASIVGNEGFLYSLKNILNEHDVNSGKISHGNCGSAYELRVNGVHNLKEFYSLIYNNSSVQLKRKKEIFESSFKEYCPSK